MNFFASQDRARRQSIYLLFFMLLAVVVIAALLNLVVYGLAIFLDLVIHDVRAWLQQPWWMLVSASVFLVVASGSLVQFLALRGGGRVIAERVEARLIEFDSKDTLERRLINVVEEMSIASGTSVPALYVMDDEPGINAFVAGYKPTEAVMVVTRGALEQLDRDQLQGVVGHEYSHILNGDMRLNVRLMAILHGILVLGIAGQGMLRVVFSGSRRRSRYGSSRASFSSSDSSSSSGSSGRGGGQIMVAIIALGATLWLLGYVGVFFGRVIKAAVSRQREFLADASAVQFTRNPDGIAGALWQIREHSEGALLLSSHAEETSHMCFGEGVSMGLGGALATHPPLEARVKAIDPNFRAKMAARRIKEGQQSTTSDGGAGQSAAAGSSSAAAASFTGEGASASAPNSASLTGAASGAVLAQAATAPSGSRTTFRVGSASEVVAKVGAPQPEHMDYAASLHAQLPKSLTTAAHVPELALALVYALLLGDVDEAKLTLGIAMVKHRAGPSSAAAAARLHAVMGSLDERFRLPLLELSMPSLKRLPRAARAELVDNASKLVRVDGRVSLFEFALLTLLRKHLAENAGQAEGARFFKFGPVLADVRGLLSMLAYAGASDDAQAQAAFDRAIIGFDKQTPIVARDLCDPGSMSESLKRLSRLAPLLKQPVLEACTDCVAHDEKVTLGESELLRAIAESLDCPMPPLAVSL